MRGGAVSDLRARAAAMRTAFDRGFADAPAAAPGAHEDLLAIRVEGQARALALAEVRAVHVERRITAVPGPEPALRGLAAFRGAILPVWDLHVLLGAAPVDRPRWLIVAAGAPVALAFATFEGHLRVPREAITTGAVRVLEAGGVPRTMISLPGLLDLIDRRTAGRIHRES